MMGKKPVLALCVGIIIGVGASYAPTLWNGAGMLNQPYADQQGRTISSLSADDVVQLRKGAGWGLAKPAEFNGFPGPAHVLELADKIDLEPGQRQAVQASFDAMQARAKDLGEKLIAAEMALDEGFKGGEMTGDVLRAALESAEAARAELRLVHLAAHLEVTPLLSEMQKKLYAELRGYGSGHSGHSGH
ncbi:hypothetical protein ACFQ14_15050 [Pseudahrensia aquimaris]|uniref:Periplasmic heavy metal sensor n=1 Tax=Pseudahrensia aquimaris TaxID=744461 RepID=A0ABW3FID5_9HYPH